MKVKISNIIEALEEFAPLHYQEDYDNCGLQTGDKDAECTGALLTLDCTEEIVHEAIALGCNLIIAHHPVIFGGLKKLTGSTYVERTVILAIRHNIAIYAAHTNFDNVKEGVNKKICDKLGITATRILSVKKNQLKKMVTYVPATHHEEVLSALFEAGAGKIGNYDHCSFNLEGTGTFRGNAGTNPFIGKPGELSKEKEIRVETIFPAIAESGILKALLKYHPYEEVAYDLYAVTNNYPAVGSGMLGELAEEQDEKEFLKHVKSVFGPAVLKHTGLRGKPVKKVAVCGGSGRFLLKDAIRSGAQAFITSDFKYHEYFDAEGKILIIDTGHNESEQFTPEIFYDIIKKKFATFAIHLSKISTNPVNYF